ncbi:Non-structural maintenance of chromosomes element 4 [Favolaschia claudopus]|uniref:Non-structural maintenance of chromosomes element 4 n=1 Tax=Favolaschia claudopus TaxID=2862362 RepID=A0AAW0DW63_9AGAR
MSPQPSQSIKKDLAYDPDQDPEEIREIRRAYYELHEILADSGQHKKLEAHLQCADQIFDKVKRTQEALLDSSFFSKTVDLETRRARDLKFGTGIFDVNDFVLRLVAFMGGYKPPEDVSSDDSDIEESDLPLDWRKIGHRVLAKSRRVPAAAFMLGPISIEQKKRAPNKRRARLEKDPNDERRPQEIREVDIARAENETTKNVQAMLMKLDEVERINMFYLVINPQSFAQSVENVFYLSFLIREAKVAFEVEDSGEPVVFATEPPSDDEREKGVRSRQLIFDFDMATWKRAIEVFKIEQSFIPTRPAARTRLGNQWYG